MARFLIVLLVAALASGQLAAQSVRSPPNSDERTLLRLEDSWASALVRRDGATFRRLLADGFVYSENDRTSTREEVLRDIGAETVTAAHNEDMRVHRFGTTAVVTGWLVVRGHGPGGPFDRRYRFTDTWVRRNGSWQIVAAHDYIAPAAPARR
jgi:ketosteroid isomerase-like protein